MKSTFLCIVMAFLICSPTFKVFGQAESGTVVGTVTDPAGAVTPNATVTITNVATGLNRAVSERFPGPAINYSGCGLRFVAERKME